MFWLVYDFLQKCRVAYYTYTVVIDVLIIQKISSFQITREKEDLLSIDPNDPHLKKELVTEKLTVLVILS